MNNLSRVQRTLKRRKYVRFLLEYLKECSYFNCRHVAEAYYEKYYYPSQNRDKIIFILTKRVAGYIGLLSAYDFIPIVRHNGSWLHIYKKTPELLTALKKLLKAKCKSFGAQMAEDPDQSRVEWRSFQDLEKLEVFDPRAVKMHFLGTGPLDPYFKKLFKEIIS